MKKEMRNPKITVIVPVYNMENYIEDALVSLINQSFKDIEILVVNDGSTDHTLEIVDKIRRQDERIKVISQENKGLSGARNTGLQYALGEYIGFVDGDDIVDNDMYEVLFENARRENAEVSECLCYRFSDYGCIGKKEKDECVYYLKDREILENYFIGNHNGSVNFRIMKAELIKCHTFRTDMINFEDVYFTYECLKECRSSCYQRMAKYGYRIRGGSLSSADRYTANTMNVYYYSKMILEDVKECYPELEDMASAFVFNANLEITRRMAFVKNTVDEENDNYQLVLEVLRKTYNSAKNEISIGRKIEYFLLQNTRYGNYYLWKIVNGLREIVKSIGKKTI